MCVFSCDARGKFRTCVADARPHAARVPPLKIAPMSSQYCHTCHEASTQANEDVEQAHYCADKPHASVGVVELAHRTTKSLVQEDNMMSEPEVEQKPS